uniref:Uncharacterized protein n=1 Tax=Anguilla anguilla TaxID=7936 RepID=A0A0E9T1J5_ANGAN
MDGWMLHQRKGTSMKMCSSPHNY